MRLSVLCAAMLALGACQEAEMPEPQDGQAIYMESCAICHGASGRGDGPLAASLETRPRDLTRLAQGGAFPHTRVMSVVDGFDRGYHDLPDMPEFGVLLTGDLIPFDLGDGVMTPTPRKLAALSTYLADIQQ